MASNHKSVQQSSLKAPSLRKMYRYFEEVKEEFHKVHWTEREEVKTYAKVVVAATFVCGMLIYLMDLIVRHSIGSLNAIFQWVFG